MAQLNINSLQFDNQNKSLFQVVMLADKRGTLAYSTPFLANVDITNGTNTGISGVHKFGFIRHTPNTGWTTVWTPGDTGATQLYDWAHGNGVCSIVSSNNGDTGVLTVSGLDANFAVVSEDITLTGTTPSVGSTTFSRVNRAFVKSNGGSDTNAGDIDISIGGTLVSRVSAGYGQTLQMTYTIPAGKTGYLLNLGLTSSKQQDAIIALFQRPENGIFRVVTTSSLYSQNNAIDFKIPPKFTEKTDIELRAKGSTSNNISAHMDIILIDN